MKVGDPSMLEGLLNVVAAGQPIELQSHKMVFNPTAFGLNLAELLAERIEPDIDVCELGLGSGVLSILAGKMGATVTGLDINPDAVAMSQSNWLRNGLDENGADFRHSQLFGALEQAELARFDLLWSNPPLLPKLDHIDQAIIDRDGFEVAGPAGRLVLDAMLAQGHQWLNGGGKMVTIATSLQGWESTKGLLEEHWASFEVLKEVELELTDECTQPYIDWWLAQEDADGEIRIYEQNGKWMHKVWFLEAQNAT